MGIDRLVADWRLYNDAKAACRAAPRPLDWPSDPHLIAVQAYGMRFCDSWKRNIETIVAMVMANPDLFPEFEKEYPGSYQNHHIIMPRLFVE